MCPSKVLRRGHRRGGAQNLSQSSSQSLLALLEELPRTGGRAPTKEWPWGRLPCGVCGVSGTTCDRHIALGQGRLTGSSHSRSSLNSPQQPSEQFSNGEPRVRSIAIRLPRFSLVDTQLLSASPTFPLQLTAGYQATFGIRMGT